MKPKGKIDDIILRLLSAVDLGSLKLKLWGYFGLFAVILVIILWVLQVVFLNNYYEGMKQRETQNIVADIEARFQRGEPLHSIRTHVTSIYRESGIYIHIEPVGSAPIVIPLVAFDDQAGAPSGGVVQGENKQETEPFYTTVYRGEINSLKTQLLDSGSDSLIKQTMEPDSDRKTLEYAVFLTMPEAGIPGVIPGDRLILYVFSPLYPQESTVQILISQLTYVTIMAVILSFLISFYLARRITKPLEAITARAEELAAGNYGISFSSSQYSEITRLSDTLSATSRELAETRTIQRDIIANVSHDLKTPLTMIRSYAEMIADLSGDDPEKRAEHLNVIMEETDRLNAMIADLLDVSKLQSGELKITRSVFSLRTLIESTVSAYQYYVEHDGYALTCDCNGDGLVFADETRIKQALDNLISNAIKYGGRYETVEIKMIEKAAYVRVEVTDHGEGIPKREIKNIWNRYYSSSAHHSRTDSTGLGLSIVKEIMLIHDAKYGVDSKVGRGSTFWFEIAAYQAEEE